MMRMRFCWIFLSVLLAMTSVSAFAQTASASLSGRVIDVQGAVITGASAELTSTERGTTLMSVTNNDGRYSFAALQAGSYKLVVHAPGFKQAETTGIVLEVGGVLEQNMTLQLGSTTDTISVEASEPLINTISGTVDSVVAGAPIQDLPLNGRDTISLAITQPGVTPMKITSTGFAGSGGGANNSGSIAGGLELLLDHWPLVRQRP